MGRSIDIIAVNFGRSIPSLIALKMCRPIGRLFRWLFRWLLERQISGSQMVGGLNPSEKYMSIGMIIPNIWENRKCSKPPTSHGP